MGTEGEARDRGDSYVLVGAGGHAFVVVGNAKDRCESCAQSEGGREDMARG